MTNNDEAERAILHCFADTGVESEALSAFGQVVRIGVDPTDKNDSEPIKADAHQLPLGDDVRFGLGVFHPPCARWSPLTSISGDPEDHPNLIPLAREIAEKHCEHWIIENVPRAPLNDPVILDGRMFGLPIRQRRAFETSFDVDELPIQTQFTEFRINGPDGGSFDRAPAPTGKHIWKAIKGYSGDYNRYEVEKAAVPRAYMDHLCCAWLGALQTDIDAAKEVPA